MQHLLGGREALLKPLVVKASMATENPCELVPLMRIILRDSKSALELWLESACEFACEVARGTAGDVSDTFSHGSVKYWPLAIDGLERMIQHLLTIALQ